MAIDIQEWKKSPRLLVAVFNQGFKARGKKPYGHQHGGLRLTEGEEKQLHQSHMKVLEQFNWDLEKFLENAADPQKDLYAGAGIYELKADDGTTAPVSAQEIKEKTDQAMKALEEIEVSTEDFKYEECHY